MVVPFDTFVSLLGRWPTFDAAYELMPFRSVKRQFPRPAFMDRDSEIGRKESNWLGARYHTVSQFPKHDAYV